MFFLFLIACMAQQVAPQNVEWDMVCVTDPIGRARLHLENNTPRTLMFSLKCRANQYAYAADVYVPSYTTYTQRVYFEWEEEGYLNSECVMTEKSYETHAIVIDVFDLDNEEFPGFEFQNDTWCQYFPGVEETTQVYTDCNNNEDEEVIYHLVNNNYEAMYFEFVCYELTWMDPDYDLVGVTFEIILCPASRAELSIVHLDQDMEPQACVLTSGSGGYYMFEYYAREYDSYYYDTYGLYMYYVSSAIACLSRSTQKEPIAEVIPFCPSNPLGVPEIELRSDIPAYAVVHCRNGPVHLNTATEVSVTIDASFDQGDVTDVCQFYKQDSVLIYSVTVEIGWGLRDSELFLDSKMITISCIYEDHGAGRSSVERVSSPYIAPEGKNFYRGAVLDGVFEVAILDVLDRRVSVRHMAQGSLIRLFITETSGGSLDFRAHTCSATNGITSYPILINGCGDGQIFDKNEGFYSDSGKVFSPYFQVFKLRGGANIWFDCILAACDGFCEGSSCNFVGSGAIEVDGFDRFGEFGH